MSAGNNQIHLCIMFIRSFLFFTLLDGKNQLLLALLKCTGKGFWFGVLVENFAMLTDVLKCVVWPARVHACLCLNRSLLLQRSQYIIQLVVCLQIWFNRTIDDIMPSLVLLMLGSFFLLPFCSVLLMLLYHQACCKCHQIPYPFALSSSSSPCVSLILSWPPLFLDAVETCSKKRDTVAQFMMRLWACHSFQADYPDKEFGFCPVYNFRMCISSLTSSLFPQCTYISSFSVNKSQTYISKS